MTDLPAYPGNPEPSLRPAAPISGFEIPVGPSVYDIAAMGADPLVTPPGEGFSGWWMRLWKTFRRSWVSLLPIVGLTAILPGIGLSLALASRLHTLTEQLNAVQLAQQQDPTTPVSSALGSSIATIYGYLGVYALIYLLLGAIGWAASIWTITKQAAGEPAPLGRAFAYGLKEFPRTFGWLLVYFLLVIGGSVCCLLPGLYAAVAGSLIVPLVIFSRGSIGDSFRLVNANFGAVLGRALTLYAGFLAITAIQAMVGIAMRGGSTVSTGATTAVQIVGVIASAPATILMIIGITLTFAEMRAKEMPTSTAALNQAL